MSLAPGTRLGPYEVTAQIGAGGMGEVYRATDTNLKRSVAIKVLPESVAGDPERLARFKREAEVLAALNHPNIAQIHGLEKPDGQVALVMELVEGPTLADRIAQGPIPVDEALPIAQQITEALEAAHEQGIVHRDLKPANVKVREDGMVKVLDFGLAKALEPAGLSGSASASMSPTITTPAMTEMGMILGTAAYMAPEQARGRPVDRRADIWAFGCVLYEMLAGRRGFEGEDVSMTLSMILQRELDFDALPGSVPDRVRQVLRLCLRKDPKQRIGDIRDVRLALDGAFEPKTGPAAAAPVATPAWLGGLPWATAAVLAVLLAAMIFGRAPVPFPVSRYLVEPDEFLYTAGGGQPALSPDGRVLVYMSDDAQGVVRLYRRPLDQLEPVLLGGTDDGLQPFFSPDGQRVGFHTDESLKVVPLAGGAAVTLTSCPNNACRGGTWHDDTIVIGMSTGGLRRVSDAGGNAETIGQLDVDAGEIAQMYPEFLPDGGAVLYTSWLGSVSSARVAVLDLATGRSQVLLPGTSPRYLPDGHLLFAHGDALWAVPFDAASRRLSGTPALVVEGIQVNSGGLAIYAVSADGSLAYVRGTMVPGERPGWVDRADGSWTPLEVEVGRYREPRVSPDGERVAVRSGTTNSGGSSIWVYEARRGLSRVTFGDRDRSPAWSPDGRNIAFASAGGLYQVAANGAGVPELVTEDTSALPYSWARSGDLIVTYQQADTGWNIGRVRIGQDAVEPLLDTRFDERSPALSPDGRWLAYVTNETGRDEVMVRPYPDVTSGKEKVSVAGGASPTWNGSGSELYYRQRSTVMSVALDAAGRLGVPGVVQSGWYDASPFRQYDSAPSGDRFLMISYTGTAGQRESQSIVLVENWVEELNRLVPTK